MKAIEILWLLQSKCNYECPYCDYNDDRGGARQRLVKMEKIYPHADWAAAWRRFYEKNGRASIYITGREASLWQQFWVDHGLASHEVAYLKGLGDPSTLKSVEEELSEPRIKVIGLVVD